MKENNSPEPALDPELCLALRKKLIDLGIGGMIVPHAGAHQSEYLPTGDERLLRLTGFSGSAGFAIILQDRAAIFVDGRYTIQSRAEVDENIFEICHLSKNPPAKWLRENIKPGEKICFDAWHFTPSQLSPFRAAANKGGGELIAIDENPIDTLWAERPENSLSMISAHGENYSGTDSLSKRKIIAGAVIDAGAKAQVLSTGDSISWLFNIRGDDVPFTPLVLALAIIYDDASAKLFVAKSRVSDEVKSHMGKDVEIIDSALFGDELDSLGKAGEKIKIAAESAPIWIKDRLENAGAKIITAPDPCSLPKATKNSIEISGIKAAHVRDGVALTRFLAWLDANTPGKNVSEISAAEKLESFRSEHELYHGPSFATISGAGPNGAIVHYRATPETNRALGNGELYLVDSGGQYPDGTTDVTRTIAIGGKPSDEMPEIKDRFTRVLRGHIRLTTQKFPIGTAGQELDVIARRPLWQIGLDYDHGTGHGVGAYLSVHEGPQRISKRGPHIPLKAGMVLSIEPGYYKEGEYGIRIENLVTVVPTNEAGIEMLGFDVLTMAPIDRSLIDLSLLEIPEIKWLNNYHKLVFDALNPHLSDTETTWLTAATAPI